MNPLKWISCNPGENQWKNWHSFVEPPKTKETRTESSSREQPARKRAKHIKNTIQNLPQQQSAANSDLQIIIPRNFNNCTIRVEIAEPSEQSSPQTARPVRKWTRMEASQLPNTSKRISGSTWVPPSKYSSNSQENRTVAPTVAQSSVPTPLSIGFLLNPPESQATAQEGDETAALVLHRMASVTAGAEKTQQAKMRVSALLN